MRSEWKRPDFKEELEEGVRRIRLDVCYDGTLFQGFQSQANKTSVEDALEEAIESLTGEKAKIFASGRTDSGVHALSQTCHFDTRSKIAIEKFPLALNAHLKDGVKVMRAIETDGSFHSRFSALAREYRYYMKFYKNYTVFNKNRALSLPFEINEETVSVLNKMAFLVKGERDFSFLSLREDEGKSLKRDIYVSEFYMDGEFLVYRIIGNAFLYHQVRSIVGTIIDTYRKSEDKSEAIKKFKSITENKKRTNEVSTIPPYGLYFYRTIYDEEEWKTLSYEIENER